MVAGPSFLPIEIGSAVRTIRIDHLYTEVHNTEAGPSNSAGRTCRPGRNTVW